MPAPSTVAFALACGTAGAFVDITTDILDGEAITRRWGRESEFDDTTPGTFSFTLDNGTGKYTPGNTASSLVIPLVEGMKVSWQVDSNIRMGKIRSATPYFVQEYASTGTSRVRIVVDDMLGVASRTRLDALSFDLTNAASPYLWWRLDEPSTTAAGVSSIDGQSATISRFVGSERTAVFGASGVAGLSSQMLQITSSVSGAVTMATSGSDASSEISAVSYSSGDLGTFGVWVVPDGPIQSLYIYFTSGFINIGSAQVAILKSSSTNLVAKVFVDASSATIDTPIIPGTPHYLSIRVRRVYSGGSASFEFTGYIDGTQIGTPFSSVPVVGPAFTNAEATPNQIQLSVGGDGVNVGLARFSDLSFTPTVATPTQIQSLATSEAGKLMALDAVATADVDIDTLPAGLSNAELGLVDFAGQSLLDAINAVVRTEQGHVYAATTGTLLAPTQKVKIRERTRPITVSQSFAITEIDGSPDFIRDITNMVSSVRVEGVDTAQTITDPTLKARVGSASTSEKTLLSEGADLRAWGQDRLIRGKNVSVRIAQFTVDPRSLPISRWADIQGLVPGDRISITGLPSAQLGFSQLEAYVLGGSEVHGSLVSKFTFYICPTIPAASIYDTDRYMANGALALASTINSAVTSMSVATSDVTVKLSTTETPYVLLIDSEQVNVTNVTAATPQVVTMTRGYNGTTAAAHTAGALIDLATPTYYAF